MNYIKFTKIKICGENLKVGYRRRVNLVPRAMPVRGLGWHPSPRTGIALGTRLTTRVKMTYAPRVHFRVLIWDGMFAFFEANFCFLVVCSFLCRFQSVVKIWARKSYIILAKCFLMNLYEHSIRNSLEKSRIFRYFEK